MNLENLKPQDQDGVIGQIISVYNGLKYMKEEVIPHLNEMEAWEAKEYKQIYFKDQSILEELNKCIQSNLIFWAERLSFYHTSPAVFLNAFSI